MIPNNNKNNEQNLDEVEAESFRVAVKTAFPLRYQQPLVEIATKALDVVKNSVGIDLLKQVFEEVAPTSFGRFFGAVGLRDLFHPETGSQAIEDWFSNLVLWLQRTEGSDSPLEWFVDAINKNENDRLILSVSEFLALSKEEVINDFVIPHYKVPKSSHIWLEQQTESAFNKAVCKSFGKDFGFCLDIFDDFRESLTVGDHVSIFEYFMEAQDAILAKEKLLKSRDLTAQQIKDLLFQEGHIEDTSEWLVHSDFVGEILYLQEAYGFCLGDYLKSPCFFEEDGMLPSVAKEEEVYDLLLSFHQIEDLFPEDDVDFPSEARNHNRNVLDIYPTLLEFALATLSRREQWTKAILLEEERVAKWEAETLHQDEGEY
jgi:hypothetical protein